MACVDDTTILAYFRGELGGDDATAIEAELDSCASCRELMLAVASAWRHNDGELGDARRPGTTVGRYVIESVLGAGAMGVVYAAHDPELARAIAIKVMARPSPTLAERFRREAQAMARLSHRNVVSVFDVGGSGAEAFVAMEQIRGRTLREWMADRHERVEILDALAQAADGLAAAHDAGIIHRDFKPENVLVGDDGIVRVGDFGLAQLGEPLDLAAGTPPADATTSSIAGTPAYLSPEVAGGAPASPRADQYSFFVVLHEALTGARPGGESRAIQPRRLARAIERGLARDPAARFASLHAVAGELRAIRRARWRYVVAGAAAAAAIAIAIVLTRSRGPSCTLGASAIAGDWNPQNRTAIATAFAATKVPYAASTWNAASTALDGYAAQWASAYDDACAATHVQKMQSEASLQLRYECLERRRVELRALLDVLRAPEASQIDQVATAVAGLAPPSACGDTELLTATDPIPDSPGTRAKVTAARAELAHVEALAASGKYAPAADLAKALSATAAAIGYAPLVAEVDGARGRILADLQRWDDAKPALENALLAAERGRHHHERGNIQMSLVFLAMQRGDETGALAQLDRAEAVVVGLGGKPANLARIADYRAQALASLGKLEEAHAAATKAVALHEQAEGKDTIELAGSLTELAYVSAQRGDLAAAVKLLERVLAIQERALGADHPRVGAAHTNLAFNLSAAGRLDEAEQHAAAARRIFAVSLGETSRSYAEASRAMVGILQRRGKFADAEAIARDVVAKLAHDPTVFYANALDDLSATLVSQQRLDEALKLREQALTVREKLLPAGHPSIVATQVDLGEILADLERCPDALRYYEQAQPHADGPETPPYLAIAIRIGRGRCLVETHRAKEAVPILREALARNANPTLDDDRRLRVMTRFVLAQALSPSREAREVAAAAQAEAVEIHADDLAAAIAKWLKP